MGREEKIGPWDLCWFKRLRIDLLCFFAIGCNFVDISFMQHWTIYHICWLLYKEMFTSCQPKVLNETQYLKTFQCGIFVFFLGVFDIFWLFSLILAN